VSTCDCSTSCVQFCSQPAGNSGNSSVSADASSVAAPSPHRRRAAAWVTDLAYAIRAPLGRLRSCCRLPRNVSARRESTLLLQSTAAAPSANLWQHRPAAAGRSQRRFCCRLPSCLHSGGCLMCNIYCGVCETRRNCEQDEQLVRWPLFVQVSLLRHGARSGSSFSSDLSRAVQAVAAARAGRVAARRVVRRRPPARSGRA